MTDEKDITMRDLLHSIQGMRQDIRSLEIRLSTHIDRLEQRMDRGFAFIHTQVTHIDERLDVLEIATA